MPIELPARIAFLKKIHLFHGLDDDEIALIAAELQEASYPAGSVIFQQDGKADNFYLIYGGSVKVVRKQEGKHVELARFVKDDYFGEMALLAKRRRSATVTAVADTSLLVLSRDTFEKLYKQNPHLQSSLKVAIHSRQLSRRLHFKWLRPDEVVYFLARKHSIVLYQSLILPVLALSVPIGFLYGYVAIAPFLIVLIAAIVSLIAVVGWIAWTITDWGNDYYIVTNQRVVWLEKVVGIYDSRQESPLGTILSVGVQANPFGRVLDYGDVIVRTFVGRIPFDNVDHPNQAARMIEEHWQRTREAAVGMEKEAMKNALRRRLGIQVATPPKTESAPPVPPQTKKRASLLRLLGASALKLRYEAGDTVIYRKHWVVLIFESWMPVLGLLALLVLFIQRLVTLARDPLESFITFTGGFRMDPWSQVLLILMVVFIGWLIYRIMDWSNDQFIVNAEQIIDLDRKPFGTESRNAAQLENILGTEYQRIGILGNIFNYGTVYITVGGTKLAFEDVIDPASVQSDIDRRRMARSERKRQAEIAAERERMAEWLATYHNNADALRREEEKKNQKPG